VRRFWPVAVLVFFAIVCAGFVAGLGMRRRFPDPAAIATAPTDASTVAAAIKIREFPSQMP